MTTSPQDPQPQPQPQPQYAEAPPPRYAPPPSYRNDPATEKNWMGTTSLILSLVGLFTWFTAIPGIVFGHLSLSAARRGEADNRGMGLAGLVIGYVVAVLGLVFWVFVVIAMIAGIGFVISECGGDNPAEWCTSTGS